MTPPIWLDGYGHRLATHPSRRCGTEVPIGQTYRYEHLRMIGWSVFEEVTIVARCGHQQHFMEVPQAGDVLGGGHDGHAGDVAE